MLDNFIEIFKTGNHTDSTGNTKIWTDSDVQEFIDNHNIKNSVPIVVSHPKLNQDTYGQVDALVFKNGVLSATFKNIDPTFEKIIASGEIKNRSIRAKKTPKGWMLDHVGFLGASAVEEYFVGLFLIRLL